MVRYGHSRACLRPACRQDMQNQPKFIPQRATTFFTDGRSVRPQVANTVARGQLGEDSFYLHRVDRWQGSRPGAVPGHHAGAGPRPGTIQHLLHAMPLAGGQWCRHDCAATAISRLEISTRRAFLPKPIGHYFYVMTHGYGAMPDYSAQLPPADRWAVASYIRALQVSQNAREAEVPSGVQVQNLKDIAEREGLPDSFAQPWDLPATAVSALPPDPSQGTPGMAPATADSPVPALSQPNSGAATAGATKPKSLKPVTR